MARICRAIVLLVLSLSCVTLADDEYHPTGVPSHTPYGDLEDFTMFPTTEYVTDDVTSLDDHTGTPEPCKNKTTSPVPAINVIGRMSYQGTTEDQFQTIGDELVSVTTLTTDSSDETGHQTVTVPSTTLDIDDQDTEITQMASTQTVAYLPATNFYDFITTITRRSNYLKSTRAPVRHIGKLSYETTVDPRPDNRYESHLSQTTPDMTTEDDEDDTPKTDGYTGVSMTPLNPEEDTTVTGQATVTEYPDETTDTPSTIHYKAVGREYHEGPMYMTTTTKAPVQHYGRLSYQTTVNPESDDHYEDQATGSTPGFTTEQDKAGRTDGHTGVSMTPLDAEDDLSTVTSHPTLIQDYEQSTDGPSATYYKAVGRDTYEEPMYKTTTTTKAPVQYYGRLAYHTTVDYVPDDHREDHATETTPGTTEQDGAGRTDGHTGASMTPLDAIEDGTVPVTGHSTTVDDHDQSTDVPLTTYKYVGRESYEGPMYRTTTTTKAPVQYYGRLGYKTTTDSIPDDHHEDESTGTTPGVTTILDDVGRTVDHTGASMTPLDAVEDATLVTGHPTVTEDEDQTTNVPSTIHYKAAGREYHERPVYVTTTTKAPVQYYGRLVYQTTVNPESDDHYEDQATGSTPGFTTEQDKAGRTDGHTGVSMTPLDAEDDLSTVTSHPTLIQDYEQSTDGPSATYYKAVGRDTYEEPMYKTTTTTKAPVQYYGRLAYHTTVDYVPDDHREDHATETTPGTTEQDGAGRTDGHTGASMTPLDAIEDGTVPVTGHSTTVDDHDQSTDVPLTTYKYVGRESYEGPMYRTTTTTKAPVQYYGRLGYKTTTDSIPDDHHEDESTGTTPGITTILDDVGRTVDHTGASMTPLDAVEDATLVTGHPTVTEDEDQTTNVPSTIHYKAAGREYHERPVYVTTTTKAPVQYYGRLVYQTTVNPEPDDHYEDQSTGSTPGFTTEQHQTGSSDGHTGFSMTPLDIEDEASTVTGHSTVEELHRDRYTDVPSTTYKYVGRDSYEEPMYKATTKAPVQNYGRRYQRTTMNLDYVDLGDHQPDSTIDYTVTTEGNFPTEHVTEVSATPSEIEDSSRSTTVDSTSVEPEDQDFYVDVTTRKYGRRKTRPPTKFYGRMYQRTTTMPEYQYGREAVDGATTDSSTVEPLEDVHSNPSTMIPGSTSEEFQPSQTDATISSLPEDYQDSTDFTQKTYKATEHPVYQDGHLYDTTVKQPQYVKTTKAAPVRYYGRLSHQSTMIPEESIYEDHEGHSSTVPSATPDSTEPVSQTGSTILEDSTGYKKLSQATAGTTAFYEEESSSDEVTYKTKQPDRPYSRNVAGYKTKEVPVVYRQRKFYQSTVMPHYHAITDNIPDSTTTYQTEDDTDLMESSPSTIASVASQNPDTSMTGTRDPTPTEGYGYDHGYFHGTTIRIRNKAKMTTKTRYHSARVPDDLGREIHVERSGHWTPSGTTDSTEEQKNDELVTTDSSVTQQEDDDDDEASATSTTIDPGSDEDTEDDTEATMTTEEQDQPEGYGKDSQDPSVTEKQKYVNTTKAPVPVQVYGNLSQDNATTTFPESQYNPDDGSRSTIHPSTEVPGTLRTESNTGVSSSTLDDGQESTIAETLTSGTPIHHVYRSTKDPAKYRGRVFESSTQVFQEGEDLQEESTGEVLMDDGDQTLGTEGSPGEDHVTDSMASIEEGITEEVPAQHEDFAVPTTMEHPMEYPNYGGYY